MIYFCEQYFTSLTRQGHDNIQFGDEHCWSYFFHPLLFVAKLLTLQK
jgi:hypothetical protein